MQKGRVYGVSWKKDGRWPTGALGGQDPGLFTELLFPPSLWVTHTKAAQPPSRFQTAKLLCWIWNKGDQTESFFHHPRYRLKKPGGRPPPPPQPFLSGLSGLRDLGLIFPGTHLRPSVCLPAPSFCQRQETGGEMLKPEEMRSHIGMWPRACWLWGTSLLLAGSPKFWSFLFPSPRSALSSTRLDHARVTLDGWRLKKHSNILAKFTPIPNLCSCVQSSESQRKSIKEPQTRAHSTSCCSNLSLGKDRKSKGANSRPSKQSWGHGSWGSQARETTASPQGWPVWCYCQLCFHLGLQRPRNIPPSPFIG